MTTTPSSSARLTCLCNTICEAGTILSNSSLPISIELCHCNPCRFTTGSLGAVFPQLNSSPSQSTLSKLTPYNSSPKATRYFCSTCGCHCFVLTHRDEKWYCLSGIIEPNLDFKRDNRHKWPKDIIRISRHDFVGDTVDGGLVPFLFNLNGREIPTWSGAAQKIHKEDVGFDLEHKNIISLPKKGIECFTPPKENDHLLAKCHCGGVSLLIKRANPTAGSNPEVIPKYRTRMCACRSCRLSTGVSLVPWAFIPASNVFNSNANASIQGAAASPLSAPSNNQLVPITFGPLVSSPEANSGQTLKHNWSSKDVCRSFCGRCGATVFYWCGERPQEACVAVGVLRFEEGSMGRRWLEWEWGLCDFEEEGVDREVSEAWLGSKEDVGFIGC